jgi:hypothetical protein
VAELKLRLRKKHAEAAAREAGGALGPRPLARKAGGAGASAAALRLIPRPPQLLRSSPPGVAPRAASRPLPPSFALLRNHPQFLSLLAAGGAEPSEQALAAALAE